MRVFEQVFLFRQPQLGTMVKAKGQDAQQGQHRQGRTREGTGSIVDKLGEARRGMVVTYSCGTFPLTVGCLHGASDQ
jgi:hypothetical protein